MKLNGGVFILSSIYRHNIVLFSIGQDSRPASPSRDLHYNVTNLIANKIEILRHLFIYSRKRKLVHIILTTKAYKKTRKHNRNDM